MTPQAIQGIQQAIESANVLSFLFCIANTKPKHTIIIGAKIIPMEDARMADSTHATRMIHSPLLFGSDIAQKEKYRIAGSTIFAKTAFPCQIRNSKNDEFVYTDVFPNTLRTHINKRKSITEDGRSGNNFLPRTASIIYDNGIKTAGNTVCATIAGWSINILDKSAIKIGNGEKTYLAGYTSRESPVYGSNSKIEFVDTAVVAAATKKASSASS